MNDHQSRQPALWRSADGQNGANHPNRSRTSLPTTDRLRGPRCSLTASCRYDMLMLLAEENGFHGVLPSIARGEIR
jgi:hypothetical protein